MEKGNKMHIHYQFPLIEMSIIPLLFRFAHCSYFASQFRGTVDIRGNPSGLVQPVSATLPTGPRTAAKLRQLDERMQRWEC